MAIVRKAADGQRKPEKYGIRPQIYPMSAERELARINIAYTNAMIWSFKPYIKELMSAYDNCTRKDSRFDDFSNFREKISNIFTKVGQSFEKRTAKLDLTSLVKRVAKIASGASIRDWIDIVKKTLGFPVYKEYYEETMEDRLQKWTADNVSYVTMLPKAQLQQLQDIILWGYQTGQPKVNVYNRIEKQLGTSKSYAKMLARDQLGTLNSQMMQYEQKSMGCTQYRWKTRHDSRVREGHRQLDGQIFSWDDPPEMYVMTSTGMKPTGRKCHPGEDYQCRCVAVPIFDVATAEQKAISHHFKS